MNRRLMLLASILFVLFSLLIVQFYKLQIKEHDKWVKVATSQHATVIHENFKRGVLYSNTTLKKGHKEESVALALDILKFHLFADPFVIAPKYREAIGSKIASLIGQSHQAILENLSKEKSRSRELALFLSQEEKLAIEHWWHLFSKENRIPSNALFFIKDYQRVHPFGKLLGQVLHTVRDKRNLSNMQAIATGGLELYFDAILKGQMGKRIVVRSPKQQIETKEVISPVCHGSDVYLTINHFLQSIAEDELEIGVKKVGAKAGFAVMMDPWTGEILAMAQYPFFNPDEYADYYNEPSKIENTSIKPVSQGFEPGSTMKAVTAAIALMANEELKAAGQEPLFNPKEKMRCDNEAFPGRGPLKDVKQHKYLNMEMAIQRSSNVYMARLVERIVARLGAKWYRDKLEGIFGFGMKTGIELPCEIPGFLPSIGKTYLSGGLEWSTPTPFSLAIGYNILVNSIQMVRAFSILGNGGYFVSPTIIKRVGAPFPLNHHPPKKVISSEIASEVVRAMKFVTKKGGGAPLGDIQGYTEAAKTSTSEKLVGSSYDKNLHFSTFIGLAPATEPKFCLLVAVDEPEKKFIPGFGTTHFGGKCAAPIFTEIAKKSLNYLGVKPDDPHGYPVGDPRRKAELSDWNDEAEKLAKLYSDWNEN
jgi:cell division protein FtsI (penicillin-binding protein 3)